MDYFIVFLLVIIIFTFLSDKKVLSIEQIQETINNLNEKTINIYNNMLVISIDDIVKTDIEKLVKYIETKNIYANKKYIILKDKNITLEDETIKQLIANYINKNECISGFVVNYEYKYMNIKKIKNVINEVSNVVINYLNIFAKAGINKYGIIILKSSELNNLANIEKVVTFTACEKIKISPRGVTKKDIMDKLITAYKTSIKSLIRGGLMILVGISVTSNLLQAIFSMNLSDIIIAVILYWTYSYVLRYMYNPIGKYKIMTRYLFPLFLIAYLLIQLANSIKLKVSHKSE